MAVETPQKSPSMDPKLAAALSWFFAPIGSLIFMLLDDFKKDEFIQYHAKLSLYYGIVNIVLPFCGFIFMFISFLNILVGCLMWILLIGLFIGRIYYTVKAYNGEKPVVPVLSGFVK